MPKKIRQHCAECRQVTTQVQKKKDGPWTCLCCESQKGKSTAEVAEIKERAKSKPRLNVGF